MLCSVIKVVSSNMEERMTLFLDFWRVFNEAFGIIKEIIDLKEKLGNELRKYED
jgi:hypothetical protein